MSLHSAVTGRQYAVSRNLLSLFYLMSLFLPLLFLAAGVSFLADLAGLALVVAGRPRDELLGLPTFLGGILPDS